MLSILWKPYGNFNATVVAWSKGSISVLTSEFKYFSQQMTTPQTFKLQLFFLFDWVINEWRHDPFQMCLKNFLIYLSCLEYAAYVIHIYWLLCFLFIILPYVNLWSLSLNSTLSLSLPHFYWEESHRSKWIDLFLSHGLYGFFLAAAYFPYIFHRSPDVAPVRAKMLYASSKDRFKRELDVTYEIQATDPTEIEIKNIQDRARWLLMKLSNITALSDQRIYV